MEIDYFVIWHNKKVNGSLNIKNQENTKTIKLVFDYTHISSS